MIHPIGVLKRQEEIFHAIFEDVYKQSKPKHPFGKDSKVTVCKFRQAVQEYLANCLVEWDDGSEKKRDEMVLLYKKRPVHIFNHPFFKHRVNGRKKTTWNKIKEVIDDSIPLLVKHLYTIDRDIYILKQVYRAFDQSKTKDILLGRDLKTALDGIFPVDDSFWKLSCFTKDLDEPFNLVGFFTQFSIFTLDDLIKLKQRDMAEIRFIAPQTMFLYVSDFKGIEPSTDNRVAVLADLEQSTINADRRLGRRSSLTESDLAHFAQLASEQHQARLKEQPTQKLKEEEKPTKQAQKLEEFQAQLAKFQADQLDFVNQQAIFKRERLAFDKEKKEEKEKLRKEQGEISATKTALHEQSTRLKSQEEKLQQKNAAERQALEKLANVVAKEKLDREAIIVPETKQTAAEKRMVLEQAARASRRSRDTAPFTSSDQMREYYVPLLTKVQADLSKSKDKRPHIRELVQIEEEFQLGLSRVADEPFTKSTYQYTPVFEYSGTQSRLPQILLQHYHTTTTKESDVPATLSYVHQLQAPRKQCQGELGLMHALATMEEWQIWKRTGKRVHLPKTSIPGLSNIEDILDFLRRNNINPHDTAPALTTYLRILTVWNLKSALFKYGPLLLALPVYSSELTFWKGKGKHQGYHAMLIVGYNDLTKSVKVRNTFGQNWGDCGYIEISYHDIFQYGHYVIACIDGPSHASKARHLQSLRPVM